MDRGVHTNRSVHAELPHTKGDSSYSFYTSRSTHMGLITYSIFNESQTNLLTGKFLAALPTNERYNITEDLPQADLPHGKCQTIIFLSIHMSLVGP